jgi:drug/metabolite transporter (DMT)-like permease
MEVALGALVALAYGSGDFLGGFASQRLRTSTVLLGSQSIGLAVALLLVIVLRDASPDAHVYVLSAIAGAVGVVAVALLYRGLAVGRMSVVAPVSAVGGAVLPVVWGLLRGERPSVLAWVGIALALIAIVIVGRGAEHDPAASVTPLHELALGAGAGIGFGIVFILFSESASGSGLWPVLIARCTSVPLLIGAVIVLRQPPRVTRSGLAPVLGAGLFDVTANALIVLAIRRGLLSLVAPVASLYPATTVVLARFVLHEKIGRQRAGGLALGLVGLALIATR